MRTITWRWFLIRLGGLLSRPPQLVRAETKSGATYVRVPTTRLGAHLTPPLWPQN